MAYLLIRDHDRVTGNAEKDARNWKRGMVVQTFEDSEESRIQRPCPAPFVWVKITGVTKDQADKYIAEHRDTSGSLVYRRRYILRWADLPNPVKNALANNRYYETTWSAIRTYIRNQETGIDE